MDTEIITKNSEETKELGFNFAKKLKARDVVLFFGELGAGKTTFIQGLAEGLEIKDRILSPTFVLQRSHNVNYDKIKKMNHIDLYRIENSTEVESLGLAELIEEDDSVTLIEWADRLLDFKHIQGYRISFSYIDENTREIMIKRKNG